MVMPVTENVAFVCLLLGLLLFLIAPILERLGGAAPADAALVMGLLLVASAAGSGLTNPGPLGLPAGLAAAMVVVRAIWASAQFAAARSRARTESGQEDKTIPLLHCDSRLLRGEAQQSGPCRKETWRTYLFARYTTAPSNGELCEHAKAWGGTSYILYFKTGFAEVTPSVNIACLPDGNDKCIALAEKRGGQSAISQPVRVAVENEISHSDEHVHVAVSMSAALNASNGPGIKVGPSAAGITLTFPDASDELPLPMGLYVWVCEK